MDAGYEPPANVCAVVEIPWQVHCEELLFVQKPPYSGKDKHCSGSHLPVGR